MADIHQKLISLHWGGGKCLTASDFLTNFTKEGYTLSIPDRADNQLFPFLNIVATKNEMPPSITFNNTWDDVICSQTLFDCTYTYSNLTDLRISSTTGPMTESFINTKENIIGAYFPVNDYVTKIISFSITLTGTRVDGLGEYSKTLNFTQGKADPYIRAYDPSGNLVKTQLGFSSGETQKITVEANPDLYWTYSITSSEGNFKEETNSLVGNNSFTVTCLFNGNNGTLEISYDSIVQFSCELVS